MFLLVNVAVHPASRESIIADRFLGVLLGPLVLSLQFILLLDVLNCDIY